MKCKREIYSPCNGIVRDILVPHGDYVYEWETLLILEDLKGNKVPIEVSSSGLFNNFYTKVGGEVYKDTLIGIIIEDLLPCGSD